MNQNSPERCANQSTGEGDRERLAHLRADEPPEELDFIKRDDRRYEIAQILERKDTPGKRRQWAAGWLRSAAGLSHEEILDLFDDLSEWDLSRERIDERFVDFVFRHARSEPGIHYEDWTPDDGDRASDPKPEGEDRDNSVDAPPSTNQEVNQIMPEFKDKLEAPIQEPSGPGDDFRKLVLVEGYDESEGRTFEYVALKKGYVEEVTTMDGESALSERVTDSVSLGSPDYLDEFMQGLERFKAKLNGSD